ncbi:unnamed protein product [Urochloa humidicola]
MESHGFDALPPPHQATHPTAAVLPATSMAGRRQRQGLGRGRGGVRQPRPSSRPVPSGRGGPTPTGLPAASQVGETASCPPPASSASATAAQAAGNVNLDDGLAVLDGMPQSESYSNMMDDSFGIDDISLSNAIPFASNEDVAEVAPTAKKRGARSSNYSVQEDEALVLAWESVSLDPVIGRDQSMKTYWKRIADHFHRNVSTPSNRSISSLSHRWSTIQECCNRWAGCIVNIDRAPPSGVTLQDRINHIQVLYKRREPHNRPFVMLHCWTLLEHNEKWNNRDKDCHPLKKKARKFSSEFENDGDPNVDEEEEESENPKSGPTNKERPPGRKQAKDRLKKGGDSLVFQSAVQEMIATKKEMEAERKKDKETKWMQVRATEDRKLAIEEENLRLRGEEVQAKKMEQECKIMFMDVSVLDETQRTFVEQMRMQIIASKMGGSGNGNDNASV